MFYGLENTQKEISDLLRNLVESNSLPGSVLFDGPEFSSRMYAANCLAKYFGSDLDSTVILSDRNQSCRLKAALNLYRKSRNQASKDFLAYTFGVFLKQFHGALLDAQSSTGRKKFSDASETTDLLSQINNISENEVLQFADKLEKSLSKLIDLNKYSSGNKMPVSVDQIRAIKEWCSISSLDGKQKFIIIEGLENASISASNALLKILEEPPADTHFILISDSSARIPATILSRVRKFVFKPLATGSERYVLSSLFVDVNECDSLKSFFIKYSGINESLIVQSAQYVVSNKPFDFLSLVKELETFQTWDIFYDSVIENIRLNMLNGILDEKRGSYLVDEIEKMIYRGNSFNTSDRQLLDFVIFRIKEVLS